MTSWIEAKYIELRSPCAHKVPTNKNEIRRIKNLVILCGRKFPCKMLEIPIIGAKSPATTDKTKNVCCIACILA